jgi:FtsH-binding integral membrane protein
MEEGTESNNSKPQGEAIINTIYILSICSLLVHPFFAIPALVCSFFTFKNNHPKRISTLIVCLICIALSLIFVLWAGPAAESLVNGN